MAKKIYKLEDDVYITVNGINIKIFDSTDTIEVEGEKIEIELPEIYAMQIKQKGNLTKTVCNCPVESLGFKEVKKKLPTSWGEVDKDVKYAFNTLGFIPAHYVALRKLEVLRDIYRDGWAPDWCDEERKLCITRFKNKVKVESYMNCPHVLSFSTINEGRADQFLNNFRDLIEEASPLLFGV